MVVLADILGDLMKADSLPQGRREAGLIAARDRLTAFIGSEVAALADRGGLVGSGLSNPGHWLAHEANISQLQGRRIVETGRLVDRFDAIGEAVAEGVLTSDHLNVLKKCLPRNRSRYRAEAFDDHHKMMVDLARELDFPGFRKACEAWIALCEDADPDAQAPEDKGLGLDFTDNRDGTTSIRGLMLTADALQLKEGLIRVAEKAMEADRVAEHTNPEASTEPTCDYSDGGDNEAVDYSVSEYTLRPVVRRGRRYWMARAVGMFANLANAAPRDGSAPDPLLVVMFDGETFERAKDAYVNGEPQLPADTVFRPGYMCETFDGSQITPMEAFRIALNHRIARCVVYSESRRVDLGRTSRLFTGASRQAVLFRDRTCVIPGCRKPGRWDHVDHVVEWQDGGRTDTANGQLLCPEHHRSKTEAEIHWRKHRARVRQEQHDTEPF